MTGCPPENFGIGVGEGPPDCQSRQIGLNTRKTLGSQLSSGGADRQAVRVDGTATHRFNVAADLRDRHDEVRSSPSRTKQRASEHNGQCGNRREAS